MIHQASDISIRHARIEDAEDLARMAADLNRHVGLGEPGYGTEELAQYGFGDRPAYQALIAETVGRTVGYAIFCDMFNTDYGRPGLWLCDLYVDESHRGSGLGKRLIQAVARIGRDSGKASVWWTVVAEDKQAMTFYERLGARGYPDVRYFEMDGDAMMRAADAGEDVSE